MYITGIRYLLLGDVNGLVEDHPCDCLVARRHRSRPVVRHVVIGVWQKTPHRQSLYLDLISWNDTQKQTGRLVDEVSDNGDQRLHSSRLN